LNILIYEVFYSIKTQYQYIVNNTVLVTCFGFIKQSSGHCLFWWNRNM